ncbi:conserved protein of unknown function [Tenacibaculum sp. 190130A14a]|uniref:Uncharacterized protein n=1 Tax=Tenacibaculum polynesiense TaxID=3137857 RepID=A0ABM9PGD8_9FLAO
MKTKWNFLICILLLSSIIYNCKNKKNRELVIVNSYGNINNGSYIFCGFVPSEVNYTYRTGKWTILTEDKYKIAEGEYDVMLKKNDSSGGCPFEYFENRVDLNKWKFFNKQGEVIEPSKSLVFFVQSKQTKGNVFLN